MQLEEARELRQELEAIEATTQRIKALWNSREFPTPDTLEDLSKPVSSIECSMLGIIEKSNELPSSTEFEDLEKQVAGIESNMNNIIEQSEEMPAAG
jgi:hypothetical protein